MHVKIATEDIEKYRLDVEVRENCTIQHVRDSSGGVNTQQTWRRRRSLGQGAFGEVWQESWEDEQGDSHYRAVKACSARKMRAARVDYKRELSALAAFSKSECAGYFVSLHGWWMDPENMFVAMEYLGYGDLSRYATTDFQEIDIKAITDNVLRGLQVMHREGFTHRDIKPQNILVVQRRPEYQKWWVKIADFGISKRILEGSSTVLHTTVGTRSYCAPEILGHLKHQETSVYSSKVDMWSVGCVLFNISSRGNVAFSEFDLVRYCDGVLSFNPQKLPLRIGDSGESLMKALLNVEPEQRPTATDALQHPWLAMADATASYAISILQPKSRSIRQPNYNSFLDSSLSVDPLLDVDQIKPTTQAVAIVATHELSNRNNPSPDTTMSIVMRGRQDEKSPERILKRQDFNNERIERKEKQELPYESSSVGTEMPGRWPGDLEYQLPNLVAPKKSKEGQVVTEASTRIANAAQEAIANSREQTNGIFPPGESLEERQKDYFEELFREQQDHPINPDSLICIKMLIDYQQQRFYLPLKYATSYILPQKLRALLGIPPAADVFFERFSDSAGAYIPLDSTNLSVYKQLYRAAKAKRKLRLRATILYI